MTRTEPRRDTDEQYTEISYERLATGEELVVYDPDNPDAWLASDAAVDAEEVA